MLQHFKRPHGYFGHFPPLRTSGPRSASAAARTRLQYCRPSAPSPNRRYNIRGYYGHSRIAESQNDLPL